jgi:CBS domain-containing protein
LQLQMTLAFCSALHLGAVMSSITDAFTRRLLELAEQKYGPPPVPYVWLAGGSQGRQEQTSPSDQDNALLLDDNLRPEHREYFHSLSRFVCDGLNACGYDYCQGDAMATNENWRQPLRIWMHYFSNWIEIPEKKALMLASIFFDLRPVRGNSGLFRQLQQKVLARSRSNGIFISYLVSNALTHRPPLGFFRQFDLIHDGRHDKTIDIKHRGIVPIVDIARVLALSEGIAEVSTTKRLLAAQQRSAVSRAMAADLIDALEDISSLRIRHQARQIRQGNSIDNYIAPGSMSGKARYRLKRSFKTIKSMQQVLASRHQAGLLR